MRIKPYKLIFLAVLLVALFASCSGNKTSETETTHPTTSGSTGNVKSLHLLKIYQTLIML